MQDDPLITSHIESQTERCVDLQFAMISISPGLEYIIVKHMLSVQDSYSVPKTSLQFSKNFFFLLFYEFFPHLYTLS